VSNAPAAQALFAMLGAALLAGCSEYGIVSPKDTPTPPPADTGYVPEVEYAAEEAPVDEIPAAEAPLENIQASFNAILQYNRFGAEVGRCDLEIAFFVPEDGDGTGGGEGRSITMPTEPGTCAYTWFDPEEEVAAGAINLRGTLPAGDAVTLTDAAPIALDAAADAHGNVTYLYDDCRRETFPFTRHFDVSAAGVDGGIPAFALAGAVGVGPDVTRVLPEDDALDREVLPVPLDEPLVWEWALDGDAPETSEGEMTRSEMFVLRNTRRSDNFVLEAIACLPAELGRVEVPVELLSQLTPDPGDDSTYAAGQADVYWNGGAVVTAWGSLAKVQTLVSLSGELRLER